MDKELMEQIAKVLYEHDDTPFEYIQVEDYFLKLAEAIMPIVEAQVQAERAKLIQEIESSFSGAHYHSPEAGRGYVNSIDVVEWVRIKRGGE